jgi:hypothetical protein
MQRLSNTCVSPPNRRLRLHGVQQRQQRKCTAQLIASRPEHLTARLRRVGSSDTDQRGLANAWLALNQDSPTPTTRQLGDPTPDSLQLVSAADQQTGPKRRTTRTDALRLIPMCYLIRHHQRGRGGRTLSDRRARFRIHF